ncbi:hypothetical protein [Spirillospora sp. NPDC029432]|uniref:hypothetical protein n=1 Tax=Spirillospora sp. NPDC029432 TaxID=3154599 RepID=UPI0034561BB3
MTVALMLLLFAVPGAAFWTLVRGLDPVGRLVVAAAASIVTVAGTAQVMLMLGAWSPGTGLLAVLALSLAVAAAGLLHRPRRPPAPLTLADVPRRPPAQGAATTRRDLPLPRHDEEGDDWLYRD